MIVDVHAHFAPGRYTEMLAGIGPRQRNLGILSRLNTDSREDVEGRLGLMDEAGVRVQVLSPTGGPYFQKRSDAIEAAQMCNDTYAELVSRHPDRFKAFVSLPLPHIEASLKEMARGMDNLGMVGVAMNTSVFDRSTAEHEFEPLYEEMDRRGAVLFYHPVQNGICSPMINDYKFTVSVGASMEDSAIVLHHIARKLPYRYPNIRMIVPHLGGILPMLLHRLDNQVPSQHPDLPERPSVTARRFYYDTVSHGSQAALLCASNAFGADHLVTGSDYPVLLAFESYSETFSYIKESQLPSDDVERILERNAAELLNLKV
jgi:6-methylsalicylate decarboxylase